MLRDLAPESVHAIIDLSDAKPGEHTYDLTTDQIQVPHDLEILQVTPSRLRLVFDQHETRQVAVKARVVGALPPGYRIASIIANPATLTITGPARHVNAIENALTDTVDATGVAGQASFETMAYLPDPLVHITGSGLIHVIVITAENHLRKPESLNLAIPPRIIRQLFGTDGIRGVAGEYPLDRATVYAIGRACGARLVRRSADAKVVLGQDTRESSGWIAETIARGLRDAGCGFASAGVLTTPGVAYLTRTHGFAAGVVISASHNPWQDNGIKLFGHERHEARRRDRA